METRKYMVNEQLSASIIIEELGLYSRRDTTLKYSFSLDPGFQTSDLLFNHNIISEKAGYFDSTPNLDFPFWML